MQRRPWLAMAQRLEIHYTPKHGSWLNIAEIELSALAAQCLGNRRIPNIEALNKELSAWETRRNADQKGVDWQFSTAYARHKLKRLCPPTKVLRNMHSLFSDSTLPCVNSAFVPVASLDSEVFGGCL
jgi:hypothetical protein